MSDVFCSGSTCHGYRLAANSARDFLPVPIITVFARVICAPRILRALIFKGWFWIYFFSVYFTHHRTVHLPVISLPASQTYPKYRTATLLLGLENKGLFLG
jgi:hypothetical protein